MLDYKRTKILKYSRPNIFIAVKYRGLQANETCNLWSQDGKATLSK